MSHVTEVQVRTYAASPRTLARLPSATSSLVFCTAHDSSSIVAVGPAPRASYKRAIDVPLYVRFVLRPGAARALFGVPVAEIASATPLDALWSTRAAPLHDAFALARAGGDLAHLVRVVDAAIATQLTISPVDRARARLLERALARLDAGARVSLLADELGTSERYLRELFRTELGISPKLYARIARLHRVLAASGDWAELASTHGFSDQAHLVHEFRALLGMTPTAYRARGQTPVRLVDSGDRTCAR